MERLTPNQEKAFRALRNFIVHNAGKSPTLKELQLELKKVGIEVKSLNSVAQYLKYLEEKGYIGRFHRKKQNIRIHSGINNKFFAIPLLGAADCGAPLSMAEDEKIEDFVNVSKKFLTGNSRDFFFIEAKGDSLNKENITEGDLILFKKGQTFNDGDIVAAVIEGCATIKKPKSMDPGRLRSEWKKLK